MMIAQQAKHQKYFSEKAEHKQNETDLEIAKIGRAEIVSSGYRNEKNY